MQIARQGQITAEQGQITDRYNAAITNLGSRSIDIRLGGIYALQRLMQDSPRDQPTIIAVLCAFVRDGTLPTRKPHKPPTIRPPTDIQAALNVVATRKTANDGHATVVDLDRSQLAGAQLGHGHLSHADLVGARLTVANLIRADLTHADLSQADLTTAYLNGANLAFANLFDARLTASLRGANLTGANLTAAGLNRADLTAANLTAADLSGARLIGAGLTGARLTGARLTGANLTGANLTGAVWPADAAVPKGWVQDTDSGRLKRTGT